MKSAKVLALFALLLVVSLIATTSAMAADPSYDVGVSSSDWQPSSPVYVNVTGPDNMTLTIRIVDQYGNIIGGRSAALVNGSYQYLWIPGREGAFNVTVQYATGITITRSFLIQQRVTQADLGRVYQAIFAGFDRLGARIDDLLAKFYFSIAMSVITAIMAGLMFNHVRTHYSKADTEFQRFMRQDVETPIAKLLRQQKEQEKDG